MVIVDHSNFLMSDLAGFKVITKNEGELGTIGDALFQINKDKIKFHSLILFGSTLEEKLEDIGLKENTDPIIPIESIFNFDVIKRAFSTNLFQNEIQNTSKKWRTPENIYQYLNLKKKIVLDKKGNKIGKIIDIFFSKKSSYTFILQGSRIRGYLELPGSHVTEISHTEVNTDILEVDLKHSQDVDIKDLDNHQPHLDNRHRFSAGGIYKDF